MSSTTAIKITAHIGDGIVVTLADAFEDIETALYIINEELIEKDEDLDLQTIKVTVEHVEAEDPYATTSEQVQWLRWYFKTDEAYTLDMVVSELDDMQETVTSFEGDVYAFDAYCACYGAHYLTPGDRVSFIKYTRREMIEREINNISESDRVLNMDKIRHLLDEDAVLAQAEQDENVSGMGGSYYVFDN